MSLFTSNLNILVIMTCFIAGCSKGSDAPQSSKPEAPQLDLSTPDRALKSYWAQKDWLKALGRLEQEPISKRLIARQKENMPKVTTGEVADSFASETYFFMFDDYRREILSVKQETDSRAVALVKITNITPIPKGVEATTKEIEEREKGEDFHYTLEREGKEWRVAQVVRLDKFTGRQNLYRKEKPTVPTLVILD
jgi:hypothetical protein